MLVFALTTSLFKIWKLLYYVERRTKYTRNSNVLELFFLLLMSCCSNFTDIFFFNCEIKFFHIPWGMYDFLSLNMYSFICEYSRLSDVTDFVFFLTLINGNTCACPRNMNEIKIRKTISQFVSDIMFLTWENSNENSKFLVEIYKKKTWHPFSIVMFSEHCPQFFLSVIC